MQDNIDHDHDDNDDAGDDMISAVVVLGRKKEKKFMYRIFFILKGERASLSKNY